MVLKYKDITYSSEDVPLFLYFKTEKSKKEFITNLSNYTVPNIFIRITSVDVALAGNVVIKDKRSALYIKIESIEERQSIQKHIFNTGEDSNAIISTPPDIEERVLEQWIDKHTKHYI